MIIPIRCPSCGKVVGDKWEKFKERVEDGDKAEEALDDLGIERYCCRSLFLTHVDLLEEVAEYKKA